MARSRAALADEGVPTGTRVRGVTPPADLAPGGDFRIAIERGDGHTLETSLPVTLAMGYLADAESAVDRWKEWIRELVGRLGG